METEIVVITAVITMAVPMVTVIIVVVTGIFRMRIAVVIQITKIWLYHKANIYFVFDILTERLSNTRQIVLITIYFVSTVISTQLILNTVISIGIKIRIVFANQYVFDLGS